jgi:tyrosine-protein kinase Etk/Wzc
MELKDSLLGIVGALYRWRMPIIGLAFVAALGTAVISLFLPNFYRATAVFLAANPEQGRPENLYSKGGGAYFYGGGNDIDRLMTIAESKELADYLIDSFDLFSHYKFNPDWDKAYHYARLKLWKRMTVKKTKRDAVELSIEDTDPDLAQKMVNAACERVNLIAKEVMRAGQRKTLASYQSSIAVKESILRDLADSLSILRSQYKIYNTRQQSADLANRLTMAKSTALRLAGKLASLERMPGIPRDSILFTRANLAGAVAEVTGLEKELAALTVGEADLMLIETRYYSANGQLGDEVERVKQLQSALDSDVPALVMLENAEKPFVKSRPRRSILVVGAGALAFIIAVLGVLFLEAYREINWREVLHAR